MNHYPHRIRLRGPWQCEPLAQFIAGADGSLMETTDDLPVKRRVSLPGRWSDFGLAEFAGRVRFRRRFGYPGRIDEFERVWLTLTNVSQPLAISLNGKPVGEIGANSRDEEFDVTGLLLERNELVADVDKRTECSAFLGATALEIRRTAFLKGIAAKWHGESENPSIQVNGMVAGHSERPLDLYMLVNGKTAAQTLIRPEAAFVLAVKIEDATLLAESAPIIQLELVDGGVVWYAIEVEFPAPAA